MATKLPDDFPHRAVLEEAGEAAPAKIRKRIADGTLEKITGIGPEKAKDIEKAFASIDTPADQADEQRAADDAGGKPSDTLEEGHKRNAERDEAGPATSTKLNTGAADANDIRSRSETENAKPSSAVAQEQPNHALDKPANAASASGAATDAERLAHCGAVYVDHHGGAYASATPQRFTSADGRIPQLPISSVPPRTGMEVRDGEDVYALAEGFGRDTQPIDWLRVRSPNTGKPFIA